MEKLRSGNGATRRQPSTYGAEEEGDAVGGAVLGGGVRDAVVADAVEGVGDCCITVAAPDELLVPEPVVLDVRVLVEVAVALTHVVPLPNGKGMRLADGLRRLSRLRPRYVNRAMTSPVVSAPPAASHSSTDSRTPLAMKFMGTSCVILVSR